MPSSPTWAQRPQTRLGWTRHATAGDSPPSSAGRRGRYAAAAKPIPTTYGLEFVRGNLLRDFLAFNKIEILPWDGGWGYLVELTPEQVEPVYTLMDRVAALTLADDLAAIRALRRP